jgi:hypothetical protein
MMSSPAAVKSRYTRKQTRTALLARNNTLPQRRCARDDIRTRIKDVNLTYKSTCLTEHNRKSPALSKFRPMARKARVKHLI